MYSVKLVNIAGALRSFGEGDGEEKAIGEGGEVVGVSTLKSEDRETVCWGVGEGKGHVEDIRSVGDEPGLTTGINDIAVEDAERRASGEE
jgi:hypothetical protein